MKVKKCPRCKSPNITLYMGFKFGKYQCKNCGYVGVMILEEEIQEKQVNKSNAK